ncbi:hypothetical protein SAY86_020622 [Trapa natans]|uniref:VQ domain-containing protein n=1 Tax=Trapa natans TaxID=22666 RepID=A0AAN7R7W3_TRANT|nr:hypothetical protein SAY86_020622 [Trapa natans]
MDEHPRGGGVQPPLPQPPPRPSPRKQLQILGPRPSPLKVRKDSHKINKSPTRPPQLLHQAAALPPPELLQPVIIFSVSPKIIHVEESKFMSTVQRLTGLSPRPGDGAGDVSPAARLASIEMTSPSERNRGGIEVSLSDDDIMSVLEGVELGQIPGILSPAPATLHPVPAELFSPPAESQQNLSFLQDLSPFWHNSPSSALFSTPIIFSPSPSAADLFNLFVEF